MNPTPMQPVARPEGRKASLGTESEERIRLPPDRGAAIGQTSSPQAGHAAPGPAKPQAWVRISFVSDGKRQNISFAVSDAYAANQVEKLKEAGWMVSGV